MEWSEVKKIQREKKIFIICIIKCRQKKKRKLNGREKWKILIIQCQKMGENGIFYI